MIYTGKNKKLAGTMKCSIKAAVSYRLFVWWKDLKKKKSEQTKNY